MRVPPADEMQSMRLVAGLVACFLIAAPIAGQCATPDQISPPDLNAAVGENLRPLVVGPAHASPNDPHVLLKCTVTGDRFLEGCMVRMEEPPGRGWGNAALLVAGCLRMKWIEDGEPFSSTVNIPITFAGMAGQQAPSGTTRMSRALKARCRSQYAK